MNRVRIFASQPGDLAGVRRWLEQHTNQVLPGSKTSLSKLQANGCLLQACDSGLATARLLGVAGLDLPSGQLALLAWERPAALPVLLDALERLAVSFGLQELHSRVKPGRRRALPQRWLKAGESGLLRRDLSRRLTLDARRARQMHQQLGIPPDYGRKHCLRLQPEPAQLAFIGLDVFDREQFMTPRAASSLQGMMRQADSAGVTLQPVSAFRSVDYQCTLVSNKLSKGQCISEILRVSAAPGYSEHHSGRAVDLTTPGFKPLEEEFAASDAFAWLRKHARDFGFRLSYPKGNRHGVAYEPWHWYYLGSSRD